MSELPELPPAPRRTRPLPAGGLEAAVREGRRRRNRAVGSAVAALAAVALAVPAVGALSDLRGDDELTFAGEGSASAPPSATPAQPSTPPPGPLLPAAYREDTDVTAGGGGSCAPASPGGDALCRYTAGTQPGSTLLPGEVATVVLGYCLPRDAAGDYVLTFGGGQEKDLVVVPAAATDEVFRFSSTVRYVDGAHERRVRRGQCIEWTGRWPLVTTDGAPVPPGDYALTLTVRADAESQANVPPPTPRLPESVTVEVTVGG